MIEDWLIRVIRCPQCLGELRLSVEERDGEQIRRASLHCAECSHAFAIVEEMALFGVKKSAAALRHQEMDAEFRWNFEMHSVEEHLSYARGTFRMAEEAIRRLATVLRPPARVLDVGAGCGYHSWQLAKHGYQAVASELEPEGLAYGDACFQSGVRFERIVTDCSLLPLADGSFDAVFCKELAHHVEDLPGLFRELRRVLKTNGILVLIEPCSPRRPGFQLPPDPAREAGLTHQDYGFYDYAGALEKEGFRIVEFRPYRDPVNPGRSRILHFVDAAFVRLFGLQGWSGWRALKKWRTQMLGGEVSLLARKSKAVAPGAARDREVEVLSPTRLEDYREAIDRMRQNVPAFLEMLEEVSAEREIG